MYRGIFGLSELIILFGLAVGPLAMGQGAYDVLTDQDRFKNEHDTASRLYYAWNWHFAINGCAIIELAVQTSLDCDNINGEDWLGSNERHENTDRINLPWP